MNEHNQPNEAWPDETNQGFPKQPNETPPPPPPDWEDSRYGAGPGGPYGGEYDSYDESEPRPSWELRDEIGWMRAGIASLKEILLDPEVTFRRMPLTGGIGGPLLFLVIFGFIGMTGSTIWNILWNMLVTPAQFATQPIGNQQQFAFMTAMFGSIFFQIIFLLLSPIFIVISTFINAGIYHLMLMLFGAATREFESTVRTVCYASGAVAIFNALPWFCGGALIVLVWGIVCTVIGLREVHQTTTMKALVAVILPLFICCLCSFFLVLFIGIGVSAIITA